MKITDKTISLEAAKLLGVVFKLPWSVPMRYMPTDKGLVLRQWRFGEWGAVDREGFEETASIRQEVAKVVEGLPDEDH